MTHPHNNDDPLRNCSNDDIRNKSMNLFTRNANMCERKGHKDSPKSCTTTSSFQSSSDYDQSSKNPMTRLKGNRLKKNHEKDCSPGEYYSSSSCSKSHKYHVKNDYNSKSSHDHSLKMQQDLVRETNLRKNGHKTDNNIKLMLNSQASTTSFIFKFGNKANTPCRLRPNSNARVFKIRKSREYSQHKLVLSANDSPTISGTNQVYHKAFYEKVERKCSSVLRSNKNPKAYADYSSDSDLEDKRNSCKRRSTGDRSLSSSSKKKQKLDIERSNDSKMHYSNSSSDSSEGGDYMFSIIEDEHNKEIRVSNKTSEHRQVVTYPNKKDSFMKKKVHNQPSSNRVSKTRSKFVSKVKPKSKNQELTNLISFTPKLVSKSLIKRSGGDHFSLKKMNDFENVKLTSPKGQNVNSYENNHSKTDRSSMKIRRNSKTIQKTLKSNENSLNHTSKLNKNYLPEDYNNNKITTNLVKLKSSSDKESLQKQTTEPAEKSMSNHIVKSENFNSMRQSTKQSLKADDDSSSDSNTRYNKKLEARNNDSRIKFNKKQILESLANQKKQLNTNVVRSPTKTYHKKVENFYLKGKTSPLKASPNKKFFSKVNRINTKPASPQSSNKLNISPTKKPSLPVTNTFAETEVGTIDANAKTKELKIVKTEKSNKPCLKPKKKHLNCELNEKQVEESEKMTSNICEKLIHSKTTIKTEDLLRKTNNFVLKKLDNCSEVVKQQPLDEDSTFNKNVSENTESSLNQKQVFNLKENTTNSKLLKVKQESTKLKSIAINKNNVLSKQLSPKLASKKVELNTKNSYNKNNVKKELKTPEKFNLPSSSTKETNTTNKILVAAVDVPSETLNSVAPLNLKSNKDSPTPHDQSKVLSSTATDSLVNEQLTENMTVVENRSFTTNTNVSDGVGEGSSSNKNDSALLKSPTKELLAMYSAKVKVEEDHSVMTNEKCSISKYAGLEIKKEPNNNYENNKIFSAIKNRLNSNKKSQRLSTSLARKMKSGSPKVLSHLPNLKKRIERLPNFNPAAYQCFAQRLKNENKQPKQLLEELAVNFDGDNFDEILKKVDRTKLLSKETFYRKCKQKTHTSSPKTSVLSCGEVAKSQTVSYNNTPSCTESVITLPTPTRSSLRIACKASLASTNQESCKIKEVEPSDLKASDFGLKDKSISSEKIKQLSPGKILHKNKNVIKSPIKTTDDSLLNTELNVDNIIFNEKELPELSNPVKKVDFIKGKNNVLNKSLVPETVKSKYTNCSKANESKSATLNKAITQVNSIELLENNEAKVATENSSNTKLPNLSSNKNCSITNETTFEKPSFVKTEQIDNIKAYCTSNQSPTTLKLNSDKTSNVEVREASGSSQLSFKEVKSTSVAVSLKQTCTGIETDKEVQAIGCCEEAEISDVPVDFSSGEKSEASKASFSKKAPPSFEIPLDANSNIPNSLAKSPAATIAKSLGILEHSYAGNENEDQAMNLKVYKSEKRKSFDHGTTSVPNKKKKHNSVTSDNSFSKDIESASKACVSDVADKPQDLSVSNKTVSESPSKNLKAQQNSFNLYEKVLDKQITHSYKNLAKEDKNALNAENKNRKESGFCSDNFETSSAISSVVSKSPDTSSETCAPAVEARQVSCSKTIEDQSSKADEPMSSFDMLLFAANLASNQNKDSTPAPRVEVIAPETKHADGNNSSTVNAVSIPVKPAVELQVELLPEEKPTNSQVVLSNPNSSSSNTDNSAFKCITPQPMPLQPAQHRQVYKQPTLPQQNDNLYRLQSIQHVVNGQVQTVNMFVPVMMPNTPMPHHYPCVQMPPNKLQLPNRTFTSQHFVNRNSSERLLSPQPQQQVMSCRNVVDDSRSFIYSNTQQQPQFNLLQAEQPQLYPSLMQNQTAQPSFQNYPPEKSIAQSSNNDFHATSNVNSEFQMLREHQHTQINIKNYNEVRNTIQPTRNESSQKSNSDPLSTQDEEAANVLIRMARSK